ncbi:uncharacterized protein VTP21DRAFT_280 [Calcarisporiella thermophila]|uniref:uncharacterized protein n=1 Tax=Calcarisporiella thermophila TaxID=911321 RepID=UPI00374429A8
MFYSEAILSKKGPLAKVWLAAHWEKKLSKSQFLQTNIGTTVGAIVGGEGPPLALRLSGQLLLGVVRIYSRKARYLLEDCNEALIKIKMAFRKGAVDMTEEQSRANVNTITLPDVVTEFDILLPEPELNLKALEEITAGVASQIISRREDITISEDFHLDFALGAFGEDDVFSRVPEPEEARLFDLGEEREAPEISVELGRHAPPERRYTLEEPSALAEITMRTEEAPLELDVSKLPGFEFELPPEEGLGLELPEGERMELELERPAEPELVPAPDVEAIEEAITPRAQRQKKRKRMIEDANTQITRDAIRQRLIEHSDILGQANYIPTSRVVLRLEDIASQGSRYFLDLTVPPHLAHLDESRNTFAPLFARTHLPQLEGEIVEEGLGEEEEAIFVRPEEREEEIPQVVPEEEEAIFGEEIFAPELPEELVEREEVGIELRLPEEPEVAPRGLFELEEVEPPPTQAIAGYSKNTVTAMRILKDQFDLTEEESISFDTVIEKTESKRGDAAQLFFQVLVLATKNCISVKQETPYGNIEIRPKEFPEI